ncbi:hypothetical protein ACFC1R_37175 [Kitasatospora sp. NPDC056138]|uniref:hypothetical protein n=1 Tax=Kitasatospora sp. NPDC056138 TaxID=3345724 RepID=UPI0035D5E657
MALTAVPALYQAATGVTNVLAEALPADMLATFFHVAMEADLDSRQPARLLGGVYSDCLDRGLHRAFGDLYEDRDHVGLTVAWHLGRVFPHLLPKGEFVPFIRLAQRALERSAVLPAR